LPVAFNDGDGVVVLAGAGDRVFKLTGWGKGEIPTSISDHDDRGVDSSMNGGECIVDGAMWKPGGRRQSPVGGMWTVGSGMPS
jgi:hypothetical protein